MMQKLGVWNGCWVGVRKIRLVAVTPPDVSLDLSIPNNLTPRIMDVFELVLESVEG